jgi:hypothetical protein
MPLNPVFIVIDDIGEESLVVSDDINGESNKEVIVLN